VIKAYIKELGDRGALDGTETEDLREKDVVEAHLTNIEEEASKEEASGFQDEEDISGTDSYDEADARNNRNLSLTQHPPCLRPSSILICETIIENYLKAWNDLRAMDHTNATALYESNLKTYVSFVLASITEEDLESKLKAYVKPRILDLFAREDEESYKKCTILLALYHLSPGE